MADLSNWSGNPTYCDSVRGRILARLDRHSVPIGTFMSGGRSGPPYVTESEVEAMIAEEGRFNPLPLAVNRMPILYVYEVEIQP